MPASYKVLTIDITDPPDEVEQKLNDLATQGYTVIHSAMIGRFVKYTMELTTYTAPVWQYKTVRVANHTPLTAQHTEQVLNEMGVYGFELVDAQPDTATAHHRLYILKRRKPQT